MFKKLLGKILQIINSDPPGGFYPLKDKILKQYGDKIGFDIQHVQHKCYICKNGILVEDYILWLNKSVVLAGSRCPNCNGTGIHREFYTYLSKYKLGEYTFHIPEEKCFRNKWNVEPTISGYIQKTNTKGLSEELYWWLLLFFDPKIFFYWFGKSGIYFKGFFPMNILCKIIYEVKDIPEKIRRSKMDHFNDSDIPF